MSSTYMSSDMAEVDRELSASEIANVSLRQLKIFVTVARRTSFTRAAADFGLTQSAVSRCIRDLEGELKLRLFDRTTRQVVLTQTGNDLLIRVSPLLAEIEAALRDSHGGQDSRRGVVHVSSSPMLSSILMPSCIAGCRAIYPNISVILKDSAQDQVLERVRSGEADFGIVNELNELLEADDLLMEPLFFDPFCVVLPASHALVARSVIDWRDLQDLPLVVLDNNSGSRPKFDFANGVHSGAVQEMAHASAVFRMVEVGLGLGVVPMLTLSILESHRLVVRPLQPEIRAAIMLVRRKSRSLRPNAATVWSQLAHLIASFEPPPLAIIN